MRLCYNNEIDESTAIAAYSEDSSYPVSNIVDSRASRVYRSTVVQATEFIDIAETITPTYVCLINHNVTSSATIYLEGSTGFSTWTSTAVFSTTLDWSSYTILQYITSTVAYEAWRLRVVGNSTDLSYTQIGVLSLGTYFQMPAMKPDQTITKEVTSRITIGDSGQAYGDDGYSYRSPKINLPYISSQERVDLSTVFEAVKNYKPVILDIWEADDEELPMYCVIDQNSLEFKRTNDRNYRWGTSLQFREVF